MCVVRIRMFCFSVIFAENLYLVNFILLNDSLLWLNEHWFTFLLLILSAHTVFADSYQIESVHLELAMVQMMINDCDDDAAVVELTSYNRVYVRSSSFCLLICWLFVVRPSAFRFTFILISIRLYFAVLVVDEKWWNDYWNVCTIIEQVSCIIKDINYILI